MPKKPTRRTLDAAKMLLGLLENTSGDSGAPLPPVRVLGERLGLSYATVSRLLQRFAREGRAWQHPNGRFFSVREGPRSAEGLPIVVLGRQIQHWSALYREILEGVSENCVERGCPLIFLSSEKLVTHESPELPPAFASRQTQAVELRRLAAAMPRLCAGLLVDHLWHEELILGNPFLPASRLLLARPSLRSDLLSHSPDFAAGARLILRRLRQCGCKRICLGIPFKGDQAVDATGDALIATAASVSHSEIELLDCSTAAKRKAAISRLSRFKTRTAIVCTEDNIASLLWRGLHDAGLRSSNSVTLVSMQGTSRNDTPIARLRYDYHQLGRDAVTAVIESRRSSLLIPPTFISEKVVGFSEERKSRPGR